MPTYKVTFVRVGRNHNVPPATITARTDDQFADALLAIARKHCGSRFLEVSWSFEERRGFFLAGVRIAGDFAIKEVPSPPVGEHGPELVSLPAGAQVLPAAAGGAA